MGVLPEKPWPVAEIFLGVLSTALFVVAAIGYFGDEEEAITGLLLLFGSILAALAAFFRRIEGILKISKDGAEVPIGEYQAQRGQIVPAPKLELPFAGEGTLTAEVEAKKTPEVSAGDQPKEIEPRREAPGESETPRAFLTAQAKEQYNKLEPSRKLAVDTALATIGVTPDPKFITSANTGGHAYSQRRLKDQNLRLIYRNIDKLSPDEPDRYVVLAIENIR